MPVAPTYPGVYIEEVPSGVRTITGVSTSVTAFVGYTPRGPVDRAIRVFSYADFERGFGGLDVDSALSYAVRQFFQNGGSDAYIVRVAQGAARASTTLHAGVAAGTPVLEVRAATEGIWGNQLQIDVDYDTANPASLFNLAVTQFEEQNGRVVAARNEAFRNLSMNSFDPTYAERTINASSELVEVARPGGLVIAGSGTSQSGPLTLAALDRLYTAADALSRRRLAFVLNGVGPVEFELFTAASPLNPANVTLDSRLDEIAGRMQTAMVTLTAPGAVTVAHTAGDDFILATSTVVGERSAIHVVNASRENGAETLRLGTANGGIEIDAAASVRPARTGTIAAVTAAALGALGLNGAIHIDVMHGNDANPLNGATPILLNLWGTGTGTPPVPQPTTGAALIAAFRGALARSPHRLLQGATASLVQGALRLLPGSQDPNNWLDVNDAGADTTATTLGLTAANVANLARYAPGSGVVRFAQSNVGLGSNGTPPLPAAHLGVEVNKTGIYALEDVDLFNLLCIPGVSDPAVLPAAIAYCERRRAFYIIDLPGHVDSLAEAQAWLATDGTMYRNRNAAAYFPRLHERDPLASGVVRPFPASGAIAGLYARTDAQRGVWKAPAGTEALIVGASGVAALLTDRENGVLNTEGLNCLRSFPVYGTVCWGARTMRGADQMADEYKYVPVRRLALFLEESLYRGTQWVVFEPNDEPLWAQIRLNIGAFMQNLFRQGAFQGRTPREAYLVKCDRETTTQNDINLGVVNILVGFAPLKPAEFVIIRIQQLAGQIQT